MRKPLPILKPNKRNLGTYETHEYPKPIDVEICPVCNSSKCKCEEHIHDKGEE